LLDLEYSIISNRGFGLFCFKKTLISKQSAIGYTNLHRTFWCLYRFLELSFNDLLLLGLSSRRIV